MNVDNTWSRLDSLSGRAFHEIIQAREAVFVVEQKCAYQEADDLDPQAWHLCLRVDGELAAYARVVDPGARFRQPSIGRVLTLPRFRGHGLGRRLVAEAIAFAERTYPATGIRIEAQVYLQPFYESFGFKVLPEPNAGPYDEDGIPHISMIREL